MAYQALYRVWRPRQFIDLVGQSHITTTLQNALEQKTFAHAYLFSGPRGTGKTSAAKIFAQTINCKKAPTREPCLECSACLGILDGSNPDVIEIDAASNTSVDDVRDIREKVKYASSSVPYKVYIIDEVHMISTSAFNALLKTLEEPPDHVIFILATTEPHKIPLTIISRCQRFDFKPISQQTIVDRMQSIVQSENITVSTEALEAVALSAEGGMRDALSILDQAIAYSDEQVTLDDVLAVTGSVSQSTLLSMVEAMFNQDVKRAIQSLDELIQRGKDPGRLVFDLTYFLRDMLLYKSAPSLEGLLDRARVDEHFKKVAHLLTSDWIQQAITTMNECQQDMKWTNSPKIFIEVAIIAIAKQFNHAEQVSSSNDSQPINDMLNRIKQLEKDIYKLKQTSLTQQDIPQRNRTQKQPRTTAHRFSVSYEKLQSVLKYAKKSILQHLQSKWASFLETLKATDAPAHATIQNSKPVAASETSVIVAFKYEIHCSLFLDHRELVESVLSRSFGESLTIIPIPIEEWRKVREDYINEQSKSHSSDQKEDPVVKEARKLVGDDLLHIHE